MRIVAGKFKGRTLKSPKSTTTRPTQGMLREAIFNICQNEIGGAHFLDLFAGSGAMGLEALSRGAAHVTFVEQNRGALQCIKENIQALQIKENEYRTLAMHYLKALEILHREKCQFRLIYIDPPYDLKIDLSQMAPLLGLEGILFLEERYDPKHTQMTEIANLKILDTRRFGLARLTMYAHS